MKKLYCILIDKCRLLTNEYKIMAATISQFRYLR